MPTGVKAVLLKIITYKIELSKEHFSKGMLLEEHAGFWEKG